MAERQHGVVHIEQLRRLGMSDGEIEYRVRVGRLHRLHRGVYAVGHLHLTDRSAFVAAVFAIGDDGVLGGGAAAALHGYLPWEGGEIEVMVPRRLPPRDGIVPRYALLEPRETTTRQGIPVTTPARTLLDVSRTRSRREARRTVNQALVKRRVTVPLLYAHATGPRGARLRALLADASPTRSELEDVAREFLARHGFGRAETNVRVAGFEVDVLLRRERVVIELDGARFHDNALQRADDQRKQAALEAAGYTVVRLRWRDVTRHELRTARRLAALTAPRSGSGGRGCPGRIAA